MSILYGVLDGLQTIRQKIDSLIYGAEQMKSPYQKEPVAPEYRELSHLIEQAETKAKTMLYSDLDDERKRILLETHTGRMPSKGKDT